MRTGNNKKRKKKAVPLAPPPHVAAMKSRKRARRVTTMFHKYTREKDLAIQQGASLSTIKEYDEKIQAMGGRKVYQEASQLSTSYFSTSKWVLGYLQRNGWLYGIPIDNVEGDKTTIGEESKEGIQKRKRKRNRRVCRVLEIGAINTELLDAADRTVDETKVKVTEVEKEDTRSVGNPAKNNNNIEKKRKYCLCVRAIDLHSMHPGRIEEADFLQLALPEEPAQQYDTLVCSMVLNCVTTPEDRGEMMCRLFRFLLPNGLLFLTLPKLCLTQSPFVNQEEFLQLLGPTGIGFQVVETKESPKVAFFICRRPNAQSVKDKFDDKWTNLRTIQRGKKYRNQFAVVLKKRKRDNCDNRHCKTA